MKSICYLFFALLILGGCSYKNESINLSSYNEIYTGKILKEEKTVYIESVKDMRFDKKSIGYILENEEKKIELFSNENFEKKYANGLKGALHIAGFETTLEADKAELVMNVSIKKIELIHSDKNFDKNIKGEIELEVIIKKGSETITQKFKPSATKWISPSYSSKDLEPFLNELFSDSINSVVSRLTQH